MPFFSGIMAVWAGVMAHAACFLVWGMTASAPGFAFGVPALLFIAAVTPRLPVEFAYLAYVKSRDRRYWEQRPVKPVL